MLKLTNEEAKHLINMLKHKIDEYKTFQFPDERGKLTLEVVGERRTDEFVVNIDRKGINAQGCTYQGREKVHNFILLRLDVNPTAVHINPSGERIFGSHLHIYSEEHDSKEAIPFDTDHKDLYQLCFKFFERFNIIDPPDLIQQESFHDLGR
jgi:hypothetical protein